MSTPSKTGKILIKRDKIRLSTSPKNKTKLKNVLKSPNSKSANKKDKKDKMESKDKINSNKSNVSRVKNLIKVFEENIIDGRDTSMKVDDKEVKNAFKIMLDRSKTNWGVISPHTPRKKSLKRIGKSQPNSNGKSGSIQDWLRREQI